MEAHRQDVVERLLDKGLSPTALVALLPDWEPLVDDVGPAGACDGQARADLEDDPPTEPDYGVVVSPSRGSD